MEPDPRPAPGPPPAAEAAPARRVSLRRALATAAGIAALVNAPLPLLAALDRGWLAVVIEVFLGPALNGVLALLALCVTPWLHRASGLPARVLVALALLVPLGAALADLLLIEQLHPHAC